VIGDWWLVISGWWLVIERFIQEAASEQASLFSFLLNPADISRQHTSEFIILS
jgi:hypothetical protein